MHLSCWLRPPPGNKITDAGVLLYTLRQHQDVVPRRQQHSPFSPSLVFNINYVKGAQEMDRWCFHTESFLSLFATFHLLLLISPLKSSSQASCHRATCTRGPISGHPGHPECLQYRVSVQSTFYFTGLSRTHEDAIQCPRWKPSHWRKMWACSSLFHILFSHRSDDECVLSELPIISYVSSFCIQMSDVWHIFGLVPSDWFSSLI